MDYNNIKLNEKTAMSERVLDVKEKNSSIMQRAIFEVVAIVLIVAMFMFENGYLIVKEQPLIILAGNIAIMFVLSMLFDSNYRMKGKLYGFSSERYQQAKNKLYELTSTFKDEQISTLSMNIDKFKEDKERRDIAYYLYQVGITYEQYNSLYKGMTIAELKHSELSKRQIDGIKKARKVKPLNLVPEQLLNEMNGEGERFYIGKDQRQLDRRYMIKSFSTYLLTAIIFAYFAVGMKEQFTLASLGWYLLKICFLAFRGVKSYFEAYIEIAEMATNRLTKQVTYIGYFLG